MYKHMNIWSYKMQPRHLPFVIEKLELIDILQKGFVSGKKVGPLVIYGVDVLFGFQK